MTAPLDEKGLLPCPFCGGPARTFQYNGTAQASCAALHTECAGTDVIAPVAMWNRRALSAAALPDELEVVANLRSDAAQLLRMSEATKFGEDLSVRVKKPDLLISNMIAAADALSQANSTIAALRAKLNEAQQELKAHELSFDLRYKSDMRACKRWQEATGRTMTLPDHTDLSIWLFAQLETAEAEVKRLTEEKDDILGDFSTTAFELQAAEARINALEDIILRADEKSNNWMQAIAVTASDVRAARAALNSREKAE